MGRVTPLRPPQQIPAFSVGRHTASAAMNKRNRAIDFRMVVENSGSIDFFGNEFCDRRRAIHRRQNADVISCAGFSVGPDIAFECRTQLRRQNLVVLCALGKFIVAGEIAECHVLLMHPIARRDRF